MALMKGLLGTACAAGLLLAMAAPQASAAPVALLDSPRAQDVALTGDEVVVGGRAVRGGGVRVDAVPVTGGAPRPLLSVSGPRRSRGFVRVVASSGVVAALVLVERDDNPVKWQLYTGPPAGPLALREQVPPSPRRWVPFDLDADGDRVLVSEGRLKDLRFRARLLTPGASEPIPWAGTLLPPAVLAADRVAFVGSTRTGRNVTVSRVFTIARGSATAPPPSVTLVALRNHQPVVVLAPGRYEVRFTVSADTREKLRSAQDLLRHTIPDGDTAEVFDRALTVLIETLLKRKSGSTQVTRHPSRTATGARHVPAAVRRSVWVRDGGRCAFVGAGGRRCNARAFLEFHHVTPYASGGPATADNISLRCRAHNQYEGELAFGVRSTHGPVERGA